MGLISLEPMPSPLSLLWALNPENAISPSMDYMYPNYVEDDNNAVIASSTELVAPLRPFTDCTTVVQASLLQTEAGTCYEVADVIRPTKFGSINRIFQVEYRDEFHCYIRSERELAVKVHRKAAMDRYANSEEDPLQEIRALQKLGNHHKHIIHIVEVFEDLDNIYIVMPLCIGGDLLDVLEFRASCGLPMKMTATEARRVFLQIASGVKEMHDHGIAHRDLSLENVLYDDVAETFVLIDLGACVLLPRDPLHSKGYLSVIPRQGIFGKLNYIAPEMWTGGDFFEPMKCDVWSLGVILYMLLTASTPMEKASPSDPHFKEIADGRLMSMLTKRVCDDSEKSLDSNFLLAADLLHRMLRPSPADRLDIDDVLAHPFLTPQLSIKQKI